MSAEIRVPTLGESVTEATIGQWFKKPGDAIAVDEPLVELETDKVTVEVPAPSAGVMGKIIVAEGETVEVGSLLGIFEAGATGGAAPATEKPVEAAPAPAAPAALANSQTGDMPASPAAARVMKEEGVDQASVAGSGKRGQVLKEDVMKALEGGSPAASTPAAARTPVGQNDEVREERVRMTKLRQTIARRLKDAQNTAAMLTTFNEVDMTEVMALRTRYKEMFLEKHGVKLGFMGLFVKACVTALKDVPAVNAEIDGTDLIYKNYCHIGVAVGTNKGLVVPVVRDADGMGIADIEKAIAGLGKKARDGKLALADMMGGTFTISNGGVYGSLMSTPILNAPQSGILGMHKIQQRPVAIDGEIVIRPMMYLALSYDHRVVDGEGAVTFLVRVKEALEDPQRLVLDL
ncbi:MAG: 2-oxoglutarate dehydrogenase complex dihydrolipoyllysine-residue succinyltransferase [Rhizobiales bacterium]|nr:2-oxoglutarate dehydrogenase complex dihydrolipoyllysine-residue succinyltransferase [Hyphomicrobiales bacterium]